MFSDIECRTSQRDLAARNVKNGRIHNGKQRFYVARAGGSLHLQPTKKVVNAETRGLIDKLLKERLSLAGIARAAQVSET